MVELGLLALETACHSDDQGRLSLLESCGFERQAEGTVHMERSLAEPIEQKHLPNNFVIRPIRGDIEVDDWVELHRLALGTQVMTPEYKRAMMQTPGYDPNLDLVAVDPHGRLAAYCVCFIDAEGNALTGRKTGYTDPIATNPGYWRRGLAKALILTGLSLLKERGMETARLGTSNVNIAMLQTARSTGFHIVDTVLWYKKEIALGLNAIA